MDAAKSKRMKIFYRVTTVLIATAFLITGIGNLIPFDHIAQDMAHLGYPVYFLKIIGIWKILGALAIVLPKMSRIKEWAYAGMMLDLTGASLSRLAVNDGFLLVFIPLGIAVLVTVNYRLRLRTHG
jgi:uncharacterized membrane protein YphA (DoxX/SURF4 family)